MHSETSPSTVEAVRRFSRFYTQRIGILEESLLGSGLGLSEGRIVFELGRRNEWTASGISAELGLDPGHVSRLLGSLERRKLIARRRSEADGRQAIISLTGRGRERYQFLDQRSKEGISALLAPLLQTDRHRLLSAMAVIESMLGDNPAARVPYIIRPNRPGDIGLVISRHAALYAEEYGWDESFEGLVAEVASDFIKNFDPKRERCWIAEREGAIAGSVFLVKDTEEGTAKLRLLYVEPSARGLGMGTRLVAECRQFARTAGYKRIVLWTNSVLVSARRIYEAAGYRLVKTEPHRSFGHDLVGETWQLDL